MLLQGRPDLNPYLPTSLAFSAWSQVRDEFDRRGRDAALIVAKEADRNLGMDLCTQVLAWGR